MGYFSSLKNDDPERYYSWLIFLIGTGLGIMLRGLWGEEGSLDQDGFRLAGIFLAVTFVVGLVLLIFKPTNSNVFFNGTVVFSVLSIINSLLIGIWNSSLTDTFLLLSICLSALAALSYYNRHVIIPSYKRATTIFAIGTLTVLCIGLIYRSVVSPSEPYHTIPVSSKDWSGKQNKECKNLDCPICFGTGEYDYSPFSESDIFKSQMDCWACGGTGKVTLEEFNKLKPSGPRDYKCPACEGTGMCKRCVNRDYYSRDCRACGGTGICMFCGGSGRK